MAVESEGLSPRARLPEESEQNGSEPVPKLPNPLESKKEIEVPANLQESHPTDSIIEDNLADRRTEIAGDGSDDSSNSNPFDWSDFDQRVLEAIKAVSQKEDAIVEEFDMYARVWIC